MSSDITKFKIPITDGEKQHILLILDNMKDAEFYALPRELRDWYYGEVRAEKPTT